MYTRASIIFDCLLDLASRYTRYAFTVISRIVRKHLFTTQIFYVKIFDLVVGNIQLARMSRSRFSDARGNISIRWNKYDRISKGTHGATYLNIRNSNGQRYISCDGINDLTELCANVLSLSLSGIHNDCVIALNSSRV